MHTLEQSKKEGMSLLPCAPDVCQECAVKHEVNQPHNQQSLYYQYRFYGEYKRFPKWKDAIAHCSEPIRQAWEKELRSRNVWKD